MVLEGLDPLDALYTTVGLMSTVGAVIHPLTPGGRNLAIVIIILGISSLFYTLGALAEYLIGGQFGRVLARSRMDRKIEHLQGHAIICGYGRVGRRIAQEFAEVRQPFVVVDPQQSNANLLEAAGYLYILGDAAEDAVLLQAGILQARALLAATDADAENIAITLSARALAPKLWIVARANHDESEPKLLRAGANRVLSPYALGGHRMASLARRPHLMDFLDAVMQGGDLDLALEEITVEAHSPLVGVALPASQGDLPPRWRDHTIIAIRPAGATQWIAAGRREGKPIGPGDHLVVLGPAEHRHTGRGPTRAPSIEQASDATTRSADAREHA
jgi:voltage-gated potassium channel